LSPSLSQENAGVCSLFPSSIIAAGLLAALIPAPFLIEAAAAEPTTVTVNGLPTAQSTVAGQQRNEFQAMLLKYAARCALRPDQTLDAPPDASGHADKLPGLLGLAPEWRDGTCDRACQEKVSSCLIALINRTGKHVQLSLLSTAPALSAKLKPNDNDLGFPHQEGAFFGNVFSGEAYACRGRAVEKAAQVKRFCALEPASCTGLAEFIDAGRCEDACEMRCTRLSDGSQRCAATSCKDPQGRRWSAPITTYLRNRIEAGNADELDGTRAAKDEAFEPRAKLGAARFERVDFGRDGGAVHTFTAHLAAQHAGARIEVWLEDGKRLGILDVKSTGNAEQDQTVAIDARGVSGSHGVVLKLFDATKIGRISTIEFR
jgi:hypothetical protein